MGDDLTERIEVRRLFIGSMAKFGLLFGVFAGIVVGIVVLMLGFAGANFIDFIIPDEFAFSSFDNQFVLMLSGISVVATFFAVFLGSILFGLLYNLSALLGGRISLGMAAHVGALHSQKTAGSTDKNAKVAVQSATAPAATVVGV